MRNQALDALYPSQGVNEDQIQLWGKGVSLLLWRQREMMLLKHVCLIVVCLNEGQASPELRL
jgi:hypothetical protein